MTTSRLPAGGDRQMVPTIAIVIAGLAFLGVIFLLGAVFGLDEGTAEWPMTVRYVLVPLIALFVAAWVLFIGYVNVDAGRRGMSRLLWTLVVIFVPNALGFVLYFLMRHPLLVECPACGSRNGPGMPYCPQCGRQLTETCPNCRLAVEPRDSFCSNCGQALRESRPEAGSPSAS